MIINNNSLDDLSKYILELYYTSETPAEELERVIILLDKLKNQKNYNYKIIENLAEEDQEILADEIRIAATRGKFRVVSGGGAALTLSGSKKLNFIHGPILIIREDNKIRRVYPSGEQGIKGSKITTLDFIRGILKGTKTEIIENEFSFSEHDLRNMIINYPRIIEPDLTFVDIEINIGSSIIDLVMQDKDLNHLLLEFKLTAKDSTIGQVTRYGIENYSKIANIPINKIRRGIVSLTYSGQLVNACKEQNIELYIINSKNKGFK